MSNIFDVAILGSGTAGSFAALKLSKENKKIKTILFELGRAPQKRRVQLCGYLGALPSGDGKLFSHDLNKVSDLIGNKLIKKSHKFVMNTLSQIGDFKLIKDKSPLVSMDKKLIRAGYSFHLNDHVQIFPKEIHMLSRYISSSMEEGKNITYSFDNEIHAITKQKGVFQISTDKGQFFAKKIIMAVGRHGWRFANKIYKDFGIIDDNDTARFGIRLELSSSHMKDFNKSNMTINKGELEIGPLSWYGTVIPEDHMDMAISAFRANENRWKTDKVSFNLIANRPFPNGGFEQVDRLSKLTFILTNDRILKERVSYILNGKSKISILPEYNWLKQAIEDFATVVPEIATKGYFHVPTILPLASKINIGKNLESEIDGMYVVGESAGIIGILAAMVTGSIAAQEIVK